MNLRLVKDAVDAIMEKGGAVLLKIPVRKVKETVMVPGTGEAMMVILDVKAVLSVAAIIVRSLELTITRRMTAVKNHPHHQVLRGHFLMDHHQGHL